MHYSHVRHFTNNISCDTHSAETKEFFFLNGFQQNATILLCSRDRVDIARRMSIYIWYVRHVSVSQAQCTLETSAV
jgi:hypothetical protein